MIFELRTKHNLGMNGETIPAGQLVAVVEVKPGVLIENIISGLYFGDILALAQAGDSEQATDTKTVRRETSGPNSRDDLDPDALNAQDDDELIDPKTDVKNSLTTQTENDDAEDVGTDAEISYPALAGLSPRIAKALGDAGLVDKAKVGAYLKENEGFDLEGIGKAAERKIIAWLES